jgi:tetratricopeptide (TPR) repeat protein
VAAGDFRHYVCCDHGIRAGGGEDGIETRARDEADKRDLQKQIADMAAKQDQMAALFQAALGAKLDAKLAADPAVGGTADQTTEGITKDLNAAVATLVAAGKGDALADKTGADAKTALMAMIGERSAARATVDTARSTIARDEAALWRQYGALAFLNDTADGIAAYTRATELDPDDAEGWNQLGHLLDRSGDLAGAQRAYRRVLALGEAAGDQTLTAIASGNLGIVLKTRGDLDGAEAMYRKSLAIEEALGRKEGMASDYGNLGNVFRVRGDTAGACAHWTRARDLFREIGAKPKVAQAEELLQQNGCNGTGEA